MFYRKVTLKTRKSRKIYIYIYLSCLRPAIVTVGRIREKENSRILISFWTCNLPSWLKRCEILHSTSSDRCRIEFRVSDETNLSRKSNQVEETLQKLGTKCPRFEGRKMSERQAVEGYSPFKIKQG